MEATKTREKKESVFTVKKIVHGTHRLKLRVRVSKSPESQIDGNGLVLWSSAVTTSPPRHHGRKKLK